MRAAPSTLTTTMALRVLDDTVRRLLLDGLERGVPLDSLAAILGVGYTTLREWLRIASTGATTWADGVVVTADAQRTLQALQADIASARARYEARALEEIASWGADDGRGRRDWRARAWVLEHHPAYRERWRQERQTTIDSHVTVSDERQRLRELSTDQLVELLPAGWREIAAPTNESAPQDAR